MKKIVAAIAMIVLLLAAAAYGEGQTNPYFDTVRKVEASFDRSDVHSAGNWLEFECVTEPAPGVPGVWDIKNPIAGEMYEIFMCTEDGEETVVNGLQPSSASTRFSYDFVVKGDFLLLAMGSSGSYGYTQFTVTGDFPTLEESVKAVAQKCIGAGCSTDFEKALWLHDWLTSNACYDLTYSYYSADSTIVRGTGVCDGYSRAYEMLLEEVGITTNRAIGGDHSWNYVKLNGKWHHIDVTWDDPASGTAAVSGNENHFYMGLSDEIMLVDHEIETTECTVRTCDTLAGNYFIMKDKASKWSGLFVEEAEEKLAQGAKSFSISVPTEYPYEFDGYYTRDDGLRHIVFGIGAYDLSVMDWDGLKVDAKYDVDNKEIDFEVVTVSDPTATPVPGTTATPAPGTTATPAPGTTATPAPGTTATPAPGTTATPAPGTTATPAPGTTATPAPGTTPTPVPGTTATPAPGTTATPAPGTTPTPVPTSAPVEIEKLELNLEKITIGAKQKVKTVKAEVYPADIPGTVITWRSANEKIAKVDDDGKITGVKKGSTEIIVTASAGGKSVSAACDIKVVAKGKGVTKVKLNKKDTGLIKGKSLTLKATITPSGAKDKKIIWVSSDPEIATVNSKGKVKAVALGECTITAYGSSGKSAECKVTVTGPKVKKITLSAPKTMKIGEKVQITALIKPADAHNKELKWKVSNKKIASISKTGELTALKKGKVTVTAIAKDGSKVTAKIVIRIKK